MVCPSSHSYERDVCRAVLGWITIVHMYPSSLFRNTRLSEAGEYGLNRKVRAPQSNGCYDMPEIENIYERRKQFMVAPKVCNKVGGMPTSYSRSTLRK